MTLQRLKILAAVLCVLVVMIETTSISAQSSLRRHIDYVDGIKAFKNGEWNRAVSYMQLALKEDEEDGELTRIYGNWYKPYLPRYYMGVSLYEMGCYEEALDQLKITILNRKDVKRAGKETRTLESLVYECERFVAQGVTKSSGETACPGIESDTAKETGHENQGKIPEP